MARIGFPTDFVASVFARVHDGVTAPRRRVLLELALSQAHTASLADPSTGPDTWRVHDLVSRTVRFHDPLPARREFVVRAVCDELLARFSAAPHRFDARADQDLFHHARYATRSVVDDTGARLALLVGDKEREHADYEHAFASFARVAAHCDEVPAVGAPQLKLSALAGIARLLAAVGDGARAVPLHQQVLAARTAALGETHVDTLSSMHELAESMLRFQPSAGNTVSALAHLAMERREEQLGANHRDTLSSRLLFARASRVPGSEHLSLLREVQVLGALEKCGEMPTAELTGLQVEVSRKFRRDGHLQDARSMAERALEAQESRYGRDHPTTGRILAELAAIVLELGDFRQSRELADEAHRVLAATLGAEHPDAHAAAGWWTVPLPGGFSQLEATFVRVPDCPYLFDPELFEWVNGAPVTLQDVLGDDPDRMEDIAVGRLGFGDYLSARYFYARTFLAFARRDDLGWLTSFRGVMMLHNFATTLYLSGDLLQGRDLSMYVASGLRLGNLLQGRDLSMYVASGLRHEAELHVSRCQLALDADHGAHDRRELAIFERATDGWSLLAMEARAMTAFASGRHEDGLRGMMEVVSAKAAMLGIRNFDRLRSVARYADMLVALGRVSDAAPLVQTNLMRWRQQCGSQHPEARWTMRRHARCLELQGRTEDAELCARAAAAGAASDSGPGFAAAMAEHCPAEVLARMGLAGETPR
ncbi:MAG: tetratricopeptide repeat protein [Deltaproteobacteria bacterium]|nr:tetratricopeptide repeat protein [Deltaproteobacteria bacterium]